MTRPLAVRNGQKRDEEKDVFARIEPEEHVFERALTNLHGEAGVVGFSLILVATGVVKGAR